MTQPTEQKHVPMEHGPMEHGPMEHGPVVRLATPADHQAWLALWRAYQAFYQVAIDDATTATTWQRLLDDAEPMWCAVAEVAGPRHHPPTIP